MTTAILSKAQIIKAIESEPIGTLTGGAWVRLPDRRAGDADPSRGMTAECPVCAVGAVLRRVVAKGTTVGAVDEIGWTVTRDSHGYDGFGDPMDDLARGCPMGALSCVFEAAWIPAGDAEAGRAAAIKFVRDHFPATVEIDLGAAKPARGVKVAR